MSVHSVWMELITTRSTGGPACKRGEDVLHLGLGGKRDRRIAQAQPLGAEAYLADRLFARHVDDAASGARHRGGDLDQDGRLADAGVAADEDRGAGHEAAADHPVELADAGEPARQLGGLAEERGKLDRLPAPGAERHRGGGRRLLGERVPLAAGLAAALPLGGRPRRNWRRRYWARARAMALSYPIRSSASSR